MGPVLHLLEDPSCTQTDFDQSIISIWRDLMGAGISAKPGRKYRRSLTSNKAIYQGKSFIHLKSGFPLTCPDKIPWLFETIFPWLSLTAAVFFYIQMKQFEDDVSPSTSTINLAYVDNERAWRQVRLRLYLKICQAQRGEKNSGCGYVFC